MDRNKLAEEVVERTSNSFDRAEELGAALQKEYMDALNQLQKDVSDFYVRFGTENGMTYSAAVKHLSKVELRTFRNKLEEYTKLIDEGDVQLLAEIKDLVAKEKVTRLEGLMVDIRTELVKLGVFEQEGLHEHLTSTFKENYIGATAGIRGIAEVKASFAKFSTKLIEETIKFPWSGESFSDIIWGNSNQLAVELKRELTQGFIKGSSIQKMSSNIAKRMDNSYKNAMRVVRTESAHVLNKSAIMSYADAGVENVEFLAVMDGKTSAICFNLNGDIIPLKDAVPGVNMPPLHPNCRSTILPVLDDIGDIEKSVESDTIYSDIDGELRDKGIKAELGKAMKPFPITITGIDPHARKRLEQRGVKLEEAQKYVDDAVVCFKQNKGAKHAFYSKSGASVVLKDGKLATVIKDTNYDKNALEIMKVVSKYVG